MPRKLRLEVNPGNAHVQVLATATTPPSGVLERGISLLECFNPARLRLNLRELAELSGLDKATALRLATVLVRARMLQRDEAGFYGMGSAMLHMGMLYRSSFDLGSRLQPVLRELMLLSGETVAFYVRSGDERVCLFRENTLKEVRHHVEVGTRLRLADGGASAHVLLAYTGGDSPKVKLVRQQGYVITRSERVVEMSSVALPVFEGDGAFLGALVVIGLASRTDEAAQLQSLATARKGLALQGFMTQAPD